MPDSGDLTNAAAESITAYAHYFLRSSARSARMLHLYEQVLGCVARRQLAPEVLRDTLTKILQDRGAESAARAARLSARFFAGLATGATWLPGEAGTPPAFDPLDPIGWWQKLGAYVADRNARAVRDYHSRLAAGETGTTMARQIPEQLGQIASLGFELLGGLEELSAEIAEDYFQAVLARVKPIGFDGDVLDLAAGPGQVASTVMYVENTRDEPVVIHGSVGEVRRADGVGPAFPPDVALSPAALRIAPHAEAELRLSLRLDETIYEAGAPYLGALRILRGGEPYLDVPLRITADAREP